MKKLLSIALPVLTGSMLLISCGGGMSEEERMQEVEKRYNEQAEKLRTQMGEACLASFDADVDARVAELIELEEAKTDVTPAEAAMEEMKEAMKEEMENEAAETESASDEEAEEEEMSDEEWINAEVARKIQELTEQLQAECDEKVETAALVKFEEWKSTAAMGTGRPKAPATTGTTQTTTTTTTTTTDPKKEKMSGENTGTQEKKDKMSGQSTTEKKKEKMGTGNN
jgi:hypothetical protein